jgi:hypothetical protein
MSADLARLARLVAIEAPLKRNQFAHCAYIPWVTIEEIRTAMEREGFDWRAAVERRLKLERQR